MSPPPGTPAAPAANHVPAFTSKAAVSATAGKKFSFTVSASGYPFPNLSHSTLPNGLRWTDQASGKATIWGVPVASAAGTTKVKLTASNIMGSTSQVLAVSVQRPPALGSWLVPVATAGKHYVFNAPTFGFPVPVITASGLPPGLLFSLKGGKATLSGVPAVGSGGVHHVKVTVSNVLGKLSMTFALTVKEAPAFTSPSKLTVPARHTFSFKLSVTGYPHAIFSHTTLPAGLRWANKAGQSPTISGTFSGKQLGVHKITVTARNSFGSTKQILVIQVT